MTPPPPLSPPLASEVHQLSLLLQRLQDQGTLNAGMEPHALAAVLLKEGVRLPAPHLTSLLQ